MNALKTFQVGISQAENIKNYTVFLSYKEKNLI